MRWGMAAVVLACTAAAQGPSFEVASVKLTAHGRDANGLSISDIKAVGRGHVRGINASLRECLQWSYQLRDDQITGPSWLNDDNASYDIEAKAPPETSEADLRRMLQTLLNERFRLKLRRETKVVAVYELIVAKGGPRLPDPKPQPPPGFVSSGGGQILAGEITAARLARALRDEVHRHVFDKTGIDRKFSVALQFAPEGATESGLPSIFTAVERTLGLKLQAAKAPIEFLVVEEARRIPAEN